MLSHHAELASEVHDWEDVVIHELRLFGLLIQITDILDFEIVKCSQVVFDVFLLKTAHIFDQLLKLEMEFGVAGHVELDIDIGGFLDVSDHANEVLEGISNNLRSGDLKSQVDQLEKLGSDSVEDDVQVGLRDSSLTVC